MKRNLLLLLVVAGIFSSSCRKDLKNVQTPENYIGSTFSDVFEAFWNGMNSNYVYWSIDTTNWDNMYKVYQPKFAALNKNKTSDVRKSIQYFREMTSGLIDSHYSLHFNDPVVDSSVIPSLERKIRQGTIRSRYVFYGYDSQNYLDSGFVFGIDSVNLLSGSPTEFVAGTIHGNILYIGFNQFNLKASYDAGNNSVATAIQFFIDHLRHPAQQLKGVVVDVRGNEGGDVNDLNFLVGNLIGSKLTVGESRYKSGNGRLDYSPWLPAVVTPQNGATAVTVPIVALTDVWTTSMAELTAMSIRALPNGHVVGERTWGATGPLTSNIVLNGGQFTAANFVNVTTSSAMFRYIDGKMYEGIGFNPDYPVPFNADSFQNGDAQLEKALSLMQ